MLQIDEDRIWSSTGALFQTEAPASLAVVVGLVLAVLGEVICLSAPAESKVRIPTLVTLAIGSVSALLAIIGYSLNDTIVIFDRLRENLSRVDMPLKEAMNMSITQSLTRTFFTSVTAWVYRASTWSVRRRPRLPSTTSLYVATGVPVGRCPILVQNFVARKSWSRGTPAVARPMASSLPNSA